MKPALIVIDMQKQFLGRSAECAASLDSAAKYIAWAIEIFGKKNLPVIHIVHNEGGPEELESKDFWELDSIACPKREDVIVKSKGSAFIGTDLEARLKACGATMLIICGFAAEYCVLSTAKAAEDLGWGFALLKGALASPDPQNIPFVERTSETVSAGALVGFMK